MSRTSVLRITREERSCGPPGSFALLCEEEAWTRGFVRSAFQLAYLYPGNSKLSTVEGRDSTPKEVESDLPLWVGEVDFLLPEAAAAANESAACRPCFRLPTQRGLPQLVCRRRLRSSGLSPQRRASPRLGPAAARTVDIPPAKSQKLALPGASRDRHQDERMEPLVSTRPARLQKPSALIIAQEPHAAWRLSHPAVLEHRILLQPPPLLGAERVVGRVGLEPTTRGLKVRCSTN